MKLLELAKENLHEYISIEDTLSLIATTQETPIKHVALFLMSQNFDSHIPTYYADKFYIIHSNDEFDYDNYFSATNSILTELADGYLFSNSFQFSGFSTPPLIKDAYWKRSQLYSLEVMKSLKLDIYFRIPDINKIIKNRNLSFEKFNNAEKMTVSEVKSAIGGNIQSYITNSVAINSQVDSFINSLQHCEPDCFDITFDDDMFVANTIDIKKYFIKYGVVMDGLNTDESNLLSDSQSLSLMNEPCIEIANLIADQSLDNQNSIIDQLKKENEKLKAELVEKEQKIKELESLNCKKDTDLLSLIFDETKKERYSPDLVLAIKLWEYVYIVNPKDDSHSNKADTWLKVNTGYDVDKKAGSASKIREVTAPFINWSIHRDKSYRK